MDNGRAELVLLGHVYDDAVAFIEALSSQHRSDQANLEARRAILRRSIMVAGINRPSLVHLAAATDPLTPAEIAAVLADLQERSAALHQIMTGVSSAGQPPMWPPRGPVSPWLSPHSWSPCFPRPILTLRAVFC